MAQMTETQRWQAALQRALRNSLDVYVCGATGEAFVESASRPGELYAVSLTTCTCAAGQAGDPVCQHRAAYRAQCGAMPLDPDPAGVELVRETSDRVAITIDGQPFGFAVTDEFGGWVTFQGFFPNARRFPQADGYTLEVVERLLTAMQPAALPTVPAAPVAALAIAAA